MKSYCIKINDQNIIKYISNHLNSIDSKIQYHIREFKHYTNLIIHSTLNDEDFLEDITNILTDTIIVFYENKILMHLINYDYFYFEDTEKEIIFDICKNYLIESNNKLFTITEKYSTIWNCIYFYLLDNTRIFLNGIVNFRISSYIKYLDSIVDIAVNKFLIDKEYNQFIMLLQAYIDTHHSNTQLVHLIYKKSDSILLDNNFNIIPISSNLSTAKYLSDINFCGNDDLLNALISLLPARIEIHVIDHIDEFIETIQNIFKSRVNICTDCNICKTYKLLMNDLTI